MILEDSPLARLRQKYASEAPEQATVPVTPESTFANHPEVSPDRAAPAIDRCG